MYEMCRCGHNRIDHKFIRGVLAEPCQRCRCPEFRVQSNGVGNA